mmetsp:Transcript_74778/g.118902  ORF Transcript_74778/g.118902 Transcript_74778/m.118902 type:complete len:260 (+) Transcript_74778:415-1194(+)
MVPVDQGIGFPRIQRGDEVLPIRMGHGIIIGDAENFQPILSEVAVLLHRRAHRGHLSKVRHQSRPVAGAERIRLHSKVTGGGCKGEVGRNPSDRSDEAGHAGSAACWAIVWTPEPVVLDGLVEEDHGLSKVGSSLDDVDDAFRADPGQLFGLGFVEQVVQVAQGLLQFQGLCVFHDLVNPRNLLPILHQIHRICNRSLGTSLVGKGVDAHCQRGQGCERTEDLPGPGGFGGLQGHFGQKLLGVFHDGRSDRGDATGDVG